jgi:methylated-DNA-[protein]-cysteine S-methyltransferase
MDGVAFFGTSLGTCGVAWTDRGICGVQLPEADEAATRTRLGKRFPRAVEQAPPAEVQQTIDAMVALLAGTPTDFRATRLDLSGRPEFDRRVYEAARAIPAGTTATYGEIAARLGEPGAARAVGQSLGANPVPIVIPCHRVLAAGQRTGGFSAHGGIDTKRRLLEIEGALAAASLPLFAQS